MYDLCPWYLEQVAQQEWKLRSDLDIARVIGQPADLASSILSPCTDMDVLAIFD